MKYSWSSRDRLLCTLVLSVRKKMIQSWRMMIIMVCMLPKLRSFSFRPLHSFVLLLFFYSTHKFFIFSLSLSLVKKWHIDWNTLALNAVSVTSCFVSVTSHPGDGWTWMSDSHCPSSHLFFHILSLVTDWQWTRSLTPGTLKSLENANPDNN